MLEARGKGSRGVRSSAIDGSNLQIETLVSAELADRILTHVAERYFEDATVEDRWWARKWSLENLKSRGGMRELSAVLACRLDPDDRDDALKLLLEAGLCVAFIVDGECAPLAEAHAAFKESLASGQVNPKFVTALTEALVAHERELRAFAGL